MTIQLERPFSWDEPYTDDPVDDSGITITCDICATRYETGSKDAAGDFIDAHHQNGDKECAPFSFTWTGTHDPLSTGRLFCGICGWDSDEVKLIDADEITTKHTLEH